MGSIGTKEKRRLSFDNTFALSSPLVVPKAIEDDNIMDLNTIAAVAGKTPDESLIFPNHREYKEAEKEISDLDYWSHRVENLKKDHRMINKILEDEYEKTLQQTRNLLDPLEETPDQTEQIKPCVEIETKILKCYEQNYRQPLICSPLVQAFSNCVTSCKVIKQ